VARNDRPWFHQLALDQDLVGGYCSQGDHKDVFAGLLIEECGCFDDRVDKWCETLAGRNRRNLDEERRDSAEDAVDDVLPGLQNGSFLGVVNNATRRATAQATVFAFGNAPRAPGADPVLCLPALLRSTRRGLGLRLDGAAVDLSFSKSRNA
jgi:hypothetical protein